MSGTAELDTADAKAGACPFSSLASTLGGQQPSNSAAPVSREGVPIPGPHPLSWDSLVDVGQIFRGGGLHAAQLYFSEKYGPICRFANPASLNGATSWVFVNSPENIQHVCATNAKLYSDRYLPDIYKYVTHEKGILGSQGAYNARHRKLCQPTFRNKSSLETFSQIVVDRSQQLAAIWDDLGGGMFETDVATQTQRLTLDIVGLTAFNHDFMQVEQTRRDLSGAACDQNQSTDRLLWAVNTFGEVLAEVFITPLPLLRLMDSLGFPQLSTLHKAVDTMRESMLEVIHARRQRVADGGPAGEDLLGVLLSATDDDGQRMTDEELWEDVHDVMGAGHETTATTTASVLYCISAHPEVEAAVVKELRGVLGERPPSFADLDKLQYLTQCVKETLRLYPAIPVFPRQASADDMLPSGHLVKKGDVVFMSSYALGRCSRLWDDPLEFRPERFTPAEEENRHRYQYLPFGAGPRMCLGSNFAQMSVAMMVATLLQHHRFEPIRPNTQLIPVEYDITMNFNSTGGLKMRVGPRPA